jgi:hypothetical protein
MELHCLTAPDSLTFWWEKPEHFSDGDCFHLLLDGRKMKTLTKTHAAFENLAPETRFGAILRHMRGGASGAYGVSF